MTSDDLPSSWRLDGRVCLLTGATGGIGSATALTLASFGAELVLVGRSERKLGKLRREVRRATPDARVHTIATDLSSQAEVRRLARRVLDEVPQLDTLVNNAAVVTNRREETEDGLERQLAVNHLAPFLLTNLLLERLGENAPARVVMVASQVERDGAINFADLQGCNAYDRWRAYRQSKLANILFAQELGRRMAGRGVTPLSLHPGVYSTRLLDALMGWSPLVTRMRGRQIPGPAAAALVLTRAVASPNLVGSSAIHLHEHRIAEPSAQARDSELAGRMWEVSARLTGLER